MKYALLGLGAFFVLVGIAIAIGKLLRGPSTVEREAVADAPRFVGRAVVAGDDLAWQVDLARIYADYDTYRTELRLPGERAS